MSQQAWELGARALAARIAAGELGAREALDSVLARIAQVNPRLNALSEVWEQEARAAADAADQAQAQGRALGPLHGVVVTIKVNVDVAGHATNEGVAAWRDRIAATDSPMVASLRRAGAIVLGRNNAPALSTRWFTDSELHGRTLNPFDARITPGGSSGGAAVAVAAGMGPIAHGNDFGGSIRYPAYACGVVGLRTTVGRIPSHKDTSPSRNIAHQQMGVQGPLTRTVDDARLALAVMSQGSPLDPQWTPAPLEFAEPPGAPRVALFARHPAYDMHPEVAQALQQAARWLEAAGCVVEEAQPPHFEEAAALWGRLVSNDVRPAARAKGREIADAATRTTMDWGRQAHVEWDRDQYLDGLARRYDIARDWSVFLDRYTAVLMPTSWERPFPVDDDQHSAQRMAQLVRAQSPLLAPALLGLPGLAVPVGLAQGLPTGVQLVAARFREDRALRLGEMIERASGFSALGALASIA